MVEEATGRYNPARTTRKQLTGLQQARVTTICDRTTELPFIEGSQGRLRRVPSISVPDAPPERARQGVYEG